MAEGEGERDCQADPGAVLEHGVWFSVRRVQHSQAPNLICMDPSPDLPQENFWGGPSGVTELLR